MPRFFLPKDQLPIVTGSDAHHIRDVLRMKIGDSIELLDGAGKVYEAKISEMAKDKITCQILSERSEDSESKIKVILAQALPKARKMDFIIQKCTELGVHKIIPMLSERTVGKSAKVDRWQKIAKEAAEQSGRTIIPEITQLTKFEEVLKLRKQSDLGLIPWELERGITLKSSFVPGRAGHRPWPGRPSSILALIGPEGGFSQSEIESAVKAGFTPVSLGRRILRAETAGMAILAMLNYELDM